MESTKRYHIAVIFPHWYSFLNEVMEGVLAIHSIRIHCRFRNFISTDFNEPVDFPHGYQPDGILVSYDDHSFEAAWLHELGVPVVNIFPTTKSNLAAVSADLKSLARVAIDHFAALGFDNIGFLGTCNLPHSSISRQLFQDECNRRNLPFWAINIPDGINTGSWARLENEAPELKERLLKPNGRTGIYASHDMRARLLVDYCTDLGVKVPEEIGVLGRFDSINARLSTPELSSVVVPAKEIGTRAMQMLIDLIDGTELDKLHEEVPVREIRVRASTVGESDPDIIVLQARTLIRENACNGLTVDELIQSLPLARSTFEKRYRAITGSSPAQDIREIRVSAARTLLLTTRKTVDEVAREVGFTDSRPFVVFFKREVGETPGEFRKKHRK
ncbi:MAG: substrate-binding domain-containing protein [Akkermansiaceae bacterium]|nr:substrate-binding domain-containing protein [Akkermansiaceae bacterium]